MIKVVSLGCFWIGAGMIIALFAMSGDAIAQGIEAPNRRAFVTIGPSTAFSAGNSKLEIRLPDGSKKMLVKKGENYEISPEYIKGGAFKFAIQMMRSGMSIMPCEFSIDQLFNYNRRLICRTNEVGVPVEKAVHESVEVRVFTKADK